MLLDLLAQVPAPKTGMADLLPLAIIVGLLIGIVIASRRFLRR